MMFRVITPRGKLIGNVSEVKQFVEVQVELNGLKKRVTELCDDMKYQPTVLMISGSSNMFASSSFTVGNLHPDKLKEIVRQLNRDGYYDFSTLEYQNNTFDNGVVIDKGESLPYNSEENFNLAIPIVYNNIFGDNQMIAKCDNTGVSMTFDEEDSDNEYDEYDDFEED